MRETQIEAANRWVMAKCSIIKKKFFFYSTIIVEFIIVIN